MARKLGDLLMGIGTVLKGLDSLGTALGFTSDDDDGRDAMQGALPMRQTRGGVYLPSFNMDKDRPKLVTHTVRNIDDRIKHILEKIKTGRHDPEVIEWAQKVVSQKCGGDGEDEDSGEWCVAERDYKGEATAMFNAVRKRIRYVYDPRGMDLYKSAKRNLRWRASDCDDYVVTLGSALEAIGHSTILAVAEVKGGSPGWNHIWLIDELKGEDGKKEMFHCDASVEKPAGWHAPKSKIAQFKAVHVPE